MKRYRVEVTTPEFWFSRQIGVVQKLNVDNIVIIVIGSCVMLLSFALIHVASTFRVNKSGLMLPEVSVVLPRCKAFSCSVLQDGAGDSTVGF